MDGETASKYAMVAVNVLDEPDIEIAKVSHPEKVSHDEDYEIEFLIRKTSVSEPLNLKIAIEGFQKAFESERLENDVRIVTGMNALELNEGKNALKIKAEFEDGNGKSYVTGKETYVEVRKLGLLERIERFFRNLAKTFS